MAVASFGRAGRVSSVNVFPEGVIVVPERQADSYRALQDLPEGWSVQGIPDDQDGNLCRKRNAILRLFQGRDVVIVDDDYDTSVEGRRGRIVVSTRMGSGISSGPGGPRSELGTPFWGIDVQVDRRFYRETRRSASPTSSWVPSRASRRIVPEDLLYDEDLWLKEDYDLSLKVLHRWHRILRMNAYR